MSSQQYRGSYEATEDDGDDEILFRCPQKRATGQQPSFASPSDSTLQGSGQPIAHALSPRHRSQTPNPSSFGRSPVRSNCLPDDAQYRPFISPIFTADFARAVCTVPWSMPFRNTGPGRCDSVDPYEWRNGSPSSSDPVVYFNHARSAGSITTHKEACMPVMRGWL
jgi:hypothetical protein